jgi:hypothetical protein
MFLLTGPSATKQTPTGVTAAVPARRKWEEKWEGEERTPLDAP